MNIIKFLNEFTSDNMISPISHRREALGMFGSFSKKAALAAIPFGLAFAPRKAYAQTTNDPIAALQLALTLEYLENEFYMMALESGVIPNDGAQITFEQISQHEAAHVAFLKAGLEGAGATPVSKPTFDFTVDGAFDPFNDNGVGSDVAYAQLLALSQAFEDTGVRAYKGQAGNLMGSGFLTAALRIHSVEARHASEIRRMRGLDGWITKDNRGEGMPEATQPVYNGEENTEHGGVDVTTLGEGTPFTLDASTQAYDEILTGDEAVAIANLFIVS